MTHPALTSRTDSASDLPDRIIVGCTATFHGRGPIRLPDRIDVDGLVAAFLVETSEDARDLLRSIDQPGRAVFVDVERKQEVDLATIAEEYVKRATLHPHKPNDATVRSLDILVTHLVGLQLSGQVIGVVGTGNIAFKASLMLAERGADVLIAGRNRPAALQAVGAIRSILPRYNSNYVGLWDREQVDLMITAVSAQGVINETYAALLSPGAHVVDAGIGNLSEEFLARTVEKGFRVVRLDTRTTGSQLVVPAPGFFEAYFGRATIDGVAVVSGGVVGARGTIVVDSFASPGRVIGVADGRGGLLHPDTYTTAEQGAIGLVTEHIRAH